MESDAEIRGADPDELTVHQLMGFSQGAMISYMKELSDAELTTLGSEAFAEAGKRRSAWENIQQKGMGPIGRVLHRLFGASGEDAPRFKDSALSEHFDLFDNVRRTAGMILKQRQEAECPEVQ